MALYQIFLGIKSSIIPENMVLLTRSEQFWTKSAHIRPTINSMSVIVDLVRAKLVLCAGKKILTAFQTKIKHRIENTAF